MEQKQSLLKTMDALSEEDRVDLFSVEELETRLEMAAAGEAPNNSCNNTSCGSGQTPPDISCW